ncbi:ATP-binding protein [Novipirellula sp.]|uniref:hybrid sensor histidine kinase/response regulator n=1 Tax=Novipirellula sp. TaxID=2795430 RepID=UPI00356AD2B8
MNAVPLAVLYLDNELKHRFTNQAYADLVDRSVCSLIGVPLLLIIGNDFYARIQSRLNQALDGTSQRFRTTWYQRTWAEPRDFELRFVPSTDDRGDVVGCYIIMHDVTFAASTAHDPTALRQIGTELAKREEQRRLAFASADMGSWDYNVITGEVLLDSKAAEIFQTLPETPVPVTEIMGKIDIRDRASVIHAIQECFDVSSSGKHDVEYRLTSAEGHPCWIRSFGQVYFEEGTDTLFRTAVRVLGLLIDTTREHEDWERLNQAVQTAEAMNRTKSEFLANMSHEIRTPMTAILGFADLLSDQVENSEAQETVATIRRNGEYLLHILNEILDLSKIEAGKVLVERTRFKPRKVLREVDLLLRERAHTKHLDLFVEWSGPVPETIFSDETRLRQILINLVGNAIKFTNRGSVRIIVRALVEHEQMRFAVIDTGEGISADQKQNLFQPFSQANESITREHGGTGLGLTICQRLATLLGGDIEVESVVGGGSTFTATIATGPLENVPMMDANETTNDHETPHERSDKLDSIDSLSGTVLIVDDRRDIVFIAQRFIEQAGGRALTAENGKEAIDILRDPNHHAKIDVVLMDCSMPIMDGFAAVRQMRAEGFDLPVIALTANAMQGAEAKCLAAGYSDYLTKPLQKREFITTLAKYLHAVVSQT